MNSEHHLSKDPSSRASIFCSGSEVAVDDRKEEQQEDEGEKAEIDIHAYDPSKKEEKDGLEIGFEDIKLVLKEGNSRERLILDGSIKGKASPGRMLAIMGPSGSGKSTLLQSLAGSIRNDSKLSLFGKRFIRSSKESSPLIQLPSSSSSSGVFVEQESNFFPYMTVRETLHFRMELIGKKEEKNVEEWMNQFGLSECGDSIVGNSKIRGISGGERKRLSIACEMISSSCSSSSSSSSSVIFLDEPTTGLDSYQASKVMESLRDLAKDEEKTIVAVIHQPSQDILCMFDDLLLLSEGRMMYYGERRDVKLFLEETLGLRCAEEMGTAEFVLECISRKIGNDDDDENDDDDRLDRLAKACEDRVGSLKFGDDNSVMDVSSLLEEKKTMGSKRRGFLFEFKILFRRALREIIRGKRMMALKMVKQVVLSVIYATVYQNIGTNQASIQDRIGLLSLITLTLTNISTLNTVRTFPKEKSIITSEMSPPDKLYSTLPYFLSKTISEVPLLTFVNFVFSSLLYPLVGLQRSWSKFMDFFFVTTFHCLACESIGLVVGSISPSSDVALALFPLVAIVNIVFDGKNISTDNIPKFLKWLNKVGVSRWGFEGLMVNEFRGLEFDVTRKRVGGGGPVVKTGLELLDRFGFGASRLFDVFRVQFVIVVVCYVGSYLGLELTRPKFLKMQVPVE